MRNIKTIIVRALPRSLKGRIKSTLWTIKSQVVRSCLTYSREEFKQQLIDMGFRPGDNIIMHVGFSNLNGFQGHAVDLIDSVIDLIGPQGHLMMMSMAYDGSSREYVAQGKPFNVKRTPSQMGFVTEVFRRRNGVLRSDNPLHPVLVWGPRAEWIIEGHAELAHSCGKGSPFEKMLTLNTKALFFEASYTTLTFMHYIEDLFSATSPIAVYSAEPAPIQVIDANNVTKTSNVYTFSPDAVMKRDFASLYKHADRKGYVKKDRIGNTSLITIELRNLVSAAHEYINTGKHLHDPTAHEPRIIPNGGNILRRLSNSALAELAVGRFVRESRRRRKRALTT